MEQQQNVEFELEDKSGEMCVGEFKKSKGIVDGISVEAAM
jgi:hypothetical protein